MTAAQRRSPSQIAADDLKAQEEKIALADERIVRATESLYKAREAREDAVRRADYAAMHPDLLPLDRQEYERRKAEREAGAVVDAEIVDEEPSDD